MKDTTISVDVAKSVVEIAVCLRPGHVAETHRLPRPRFAPFFAARKPTTVVSTNVEQWSRVNAEKLTTLSDRGPRRG